MKIIVSHDVDHLFGRDHYNDLYLIKMFVRTNIEFFKRNISLKEYVKRFSFFYKKKLNNIDELVQFNKSLGFTSTFFFGTGNGLYLNYSEKDFIPFISRLNDQNFEIGIHGIEYDDYKKMKIEHEKMKCYLNDDFGIRMHYLRQDTFTISKMKDIGYLYDCSEYSDREPYFKDGIWEFPIQIMDTYFFYKNGLLTTDWETALKDSISKIEKAKQEGKEYFSILFHDVYYTNNFGRIKKWYEALMLYLVENKFEFIDYRNAIKELQND